MIFSFLYLTVILVAIYFSLKGDKKGIFILIGLLPFYTILREMTGGQPVFFIWPYIVIFIYLIQVILAELNHFGSIKTSDFYKWLRRLTLYVIPAYYFLLLIFSGILSSIISGDIKIFSSLLTDINILLAIFPVVFLLVEFFWLYFKAKKESESKYLVADIFVCIFFLYGFLHVFISFFNDSGMFNAITGFRYYYSMSILYFIVRYYISCKDDLRVLIGIWFAVFLIAVSFSYLEAYLLNCLKVPPANMPWLGILNELFQYAPNKEDTKVFLTATYSPLGIMYSQHLSGLFLVVGFAFVYPVFIKYLSSKNIKYILLLFLLLLFLPTGILFTSKTVLVLYYIVLISVSVMMYREWRKVIPSFLLFAVAIPFFISNYLLPCMKYDLGREMSYLLASLTPVNEKTSSNESIDKNISNKKNGIVSCIYCDAKTDQRVLNNAFHNLANAITADVKDVSDGTGGILNIVFGRGYAITDWTRVLRSIEKNKSYAEVSLSDTPYLKFFQQFGVFGLLFFIGMMLVILFYAFVVWVKNNSVSPYVVGFAVITLVSLVANIHLQMHFKTGLNSFAFIAMAIMAGFYANLQSDNR